jgi:hypothetical protein
MTTDLSPLSITITRDPRGGYWARVIEADGETVQNIEISKEKGDEIARKLLA